MNSKRGNEQSSNGILVNDMVGPEIVTPDGDVILLPPRNTNDVETGSHEESKQIPKNPKDTSKPINGIEGPEIVTPDGDTVLLPPINAIDNASRGLAESPNHSQANNEENITTENAVASSVPGPSPRETEDSVADTSDQATTQNENTTQAYLIENELILATPVQKRHLLLSRRLWTIVFSVLICGAVTVTYFTARERNASTNGSDQTFKDTQAPNYTCYNDTQTLNQILLNGGTGTYHICANTIINTGVYGGVIDSWENGSFPILMVNSGIKILCGENGSVENNCVFRDGVTGFEIINSGWYTNPATGPTGVAFLPDLHIEGFTFSGLALPIYSYPVLLNLVGLTVKNCKFVVSL